MSTAHIKAQSNFFKEHVEYNRIFKILGPLRSWLIQVCVSQKVCFKQFFFDKIIVLTRAVEAPKKKAGKKAPATGACRRLLRRLYIVNAA